MPINFLKYPVSLKADTAYSKDDRLTSMESNKISYPNTYQLGGGSQKSFNTMMVYIDAAEIKFIY